MSTLKQATRKMDLGRYEPIEPQAAHSSPAPPPVASPGMFTICPLPLVTAQPDGLRQFYRDGIPQVRLLPPSE